MKYRFPTCNRVLPAFLAMAWSILFGFADHASAQPFGAASFQGIIHSDSYNDEGFGFITLTLSRSGTFSMRFNVGVNSVGQHYYVRSGKFDSSGHYHFQGPPVTDTRYEIPRVIDLQLDSTDSPTRINGMLTDFTHLSDIEIEKVAVNAGKAGSYTLAVSNDNEGAPTGTGNGRVTIDRAGRLVVSGRVPGGRTFSQTANLTVYNHWPVFAKMTGTVYGILSGWITYNDSDSNVFNGQLTWLGPEVPGPNHAYVPRFVTDVSVTGHRTTAAR
ncbi:MAG: putative Peptidylprolyl isomerase [Verrucomicrobiales bacterium]|nr:putative Peptidylprolyl isomerase [Verrucomicrobiales bacterium]